MSRFLVTGATGFVGLHVVRELEEHGHEVVAFHRPAADLGALEGRRCGKVAGELTDVAQLAAAMSGCAGVFHIAGNTSWYRGDGAALVRTHVDGTRAVVDAMKRAGVLRGVLTSTVSAVGLTDDPDHPADEATPHNWPAGFHYPHTKRQAEEIWFQAGPGMTMVAVNPATVLGPGDARMGVGLVFKKIQAGKFPMLARGGFSACDVRDVASGHLQAFERGQHGQRYILGGVNLRYVEAVERIAQALGAQVPKRQLSPGLVGVMYRVVSGIEWLGLRIDVAAAFLWCMSRYVFHSTERARRELGYTPRPLDETLADSVAWYRSHKLLR